MHNRIAQWHRDRRADPARGRGVVQARGGDRRHPDRRAARAWSRSRSAARTARCSTRSSGWPTPTRATSTSPIEAAEVAVDSLADRELAATSLNVLLGRATAAWRGTAPARGKLPSGRRVAWAVDRLVDLYVMAAADATAALDLLVDASRLPFDAETRLALRHRAASDRDRGPARRGGRDRHVPRHPGPAPRRPASDRAAGRSVSKAGPHRRAARPAPPRARPAARRPSAGSSCASSWSR